VCKDIHVRTLYQLRYVQSYDGSPVLELVSVADSFTFVTSNYPIFFSVICSNNLTSKSVGHLINLDVRSLRLSITPYNSSGAWR
jgi:hypothetical protein